MTEPSAGKPTEPPAETTAPLPRVTEPPVTEPSIQKTDAYRKLLTLENAEQFDPSVLEAFAQWIGDQEDFLDTYPEKWELEAYYSGVIGLTCFTPLTEDYERTLCSLHYDGETVFVNTIIDRHYTNVPREEVAAKVYGAEDSIGVSVELKEEFIDFIMDSDWFAWSTFSPSYEKTEWYFVKEPLRPESEDRTEYIKLCVDVWSSGLGGADHYHNWIWYHEQEQEVWDGSSDTVAEVTDEVPQS